MTGITQKQIDALQEYLDSLDKGARERGRQYFEQGRVTKVEQYQRGTGFRAEVFGTVPYHIKLRFAGGDWDGTCSCPMGFDCKHCAAVALHAIEDWTRSLQPAGKKPQSIQSPETPRAGAERTSKVSVVFADRLGRKLNTEEKLAADTVDHLFQNYRTSPSVAEQQLEPITRSRAGWGRNSVKIWPTEPQTSWEAWLYLAAYLRKHKHACPPALLEATDWAEVERLMAPWERERQVEQWRDWLQGAAERSEPSPADLMQLRVRLTEKGAQLEWRKAGEAAFSEIKPNAFVQLTAAAHQGQLSLDEPSLAIWRVFYTGFDSRAFRAYAEPDTARVLNQLLRLPGFEERVVGPEGTPLARAAGPLQWRIETGSGEEIDYQLALILPDGSTPPPALTVIDGRPSLYVTSTTVFEGPSLGRLSLKEGSITIPSEALETSDGLTLLERLGVEPPPRIAGRVRTVRVRPVFRCTVEKNQFAANEWLMVEVRAEDNDAERFAEYHREGWKVLKFPLDEAGVLTRLEQSALTLAPRLVEALRLSWDSHNRRWQRQVKKNFATQFAEWLAMVPEGVTLELDPLLTSLRGAPVEARVKLEVEEAGIDWFDLRVSLDVVDTTLTKKEIRALLDAGGGFVRLGEKGWRRLHFQLSEEDEKELADLGLSARDFSSEPQRLHALQLAGKKAARRLLPEPQALAIERRVGEIQTRVAPEVPAGLSAELRPYQRDGFHFLAYLSAN
ncbi:MAG TPA: SWIM zinc finger family protein, partial [Chthoniobacter sp.]|nr:SWIM zinc finger family protein [Chthoniobacter sp.]